MYTRPPGRGQRAEDTVPPGFRPFLVAFVVRRASANLSQGRSVLARGFVADRNRPNSRGIVAVQRVATCASARVDRTAAGTRREGAVS